jgi:hypothetical protein
MTFDQNRANSVKSCGHCVLFPNIYTVPDANAHLTLKIYIVRP